jgi:hypothetical protein
MQDDPRDQKCTLVIQILKLDGAVGNRIELAGISVNVVV